MMTDGWWACFTHIYRDPAIRSAPSVVATASAAAAATVGGGQTTPRLAAGSQQRHNTYQPSVALFIVICLVALAIVLSGFQKQQARI